MQHSVILMCKLAIIKQPFSEGSVLTDLTYCSCSSHRSCRCTCHCNCHTSPILVQTKPHTLSKGGIPLSGCRQQRSMCAIPCLDNGQFALALTKTTRHLY